MKNETLQQTSRKFRDYQDILLKKIISHKMGKSKRNGTQILNQDERNNLNKLIRYIEVEAVIKNILTKN